MDCGLIIISPLSLVSDQIIQDSTAYSESTLVPTLPRKISNRILYKVFLYTVRIVYCIYVCSFQVVE